MLQSLPASMSHISSLKHLIDLQLCRSSHAAARATAHREFTANEAKFCCPVTGIPFNGSARFMILPKNGFVVSEKALKQVLTLPAMCQAWSQADHELLQTGCAACCPMTCLHAAAQGCHQHALHGPDLV